MSESALYNDCTSVASVFFSAAAFVAALVSDIFTEIHKQMYKGKEEKLNSNAC